MLEQLLIQAMTDELRVTVVVTGLGSQGKTEPVGKNTISTSSSRIKVIENDKIDDNVDYRRFDRPAVLRNATVNIPIDDVDDVGVTVASLDKNVEYLDIPAFLRREDKGKA